MRVSQLLALGSFDAPLRFETSTYVDELSFARCNGEREFKTFLRRTYHEMGDAIVYHRREPGGLGFAAARQGCE